MTFSKWNVEDVMERKTHMRQTVSEVLKKVEEAPTKQEKIGLLQSDPAIKQLMFYCYDPRVVWLLPEGPPPYKPTKLTDIEGRLYQEVKHLYLFHEGGNPNLTHIKRQNIFIQMLESMPADDAELLISIKDRKLPFKSINAKLVSEAFPGMLVEGKVKKLKKDGTIK